MLEAPVRKNFLQPNTARLINPRLRGITEVFLGGAPLRTLVQNRTLVLSSATRQYFGNFFSVVTTTSTSSRATMSPSNILFPYPNKGTIAVEVLRITTSNTGSTVFGYEINASNRILLHAPFTDGILYFDFGNNISGTGGGRVSVAYTKKLSSPTRLVCIAGPTKGREVWQDGKLLVADASANASSTKASNTFNLGAASTNYSGEANAFSLLVTSSEEWTSAEAVAWCNDPYGTTFANQQLLSVPTYYPILSNLQATRGNTSAALRTNINY